MQEHVTSVQEYVTSMLFTASRPCAAQIVPVEVTIKLLLAAIEKADGESGSKLFLVDGFPRNTNNLAGWQKTVGDKLYLGGVLMYTVAESVLEERLLARGQTSGRADDNLESIKKRFATFKNETMPVARVSREDGGGVCLLRGLEDRARGGGESRASHAEERAAGGPAGEEGREWQPHARCNGRTHTGAIAMHPATVAMRPATIARTLQPSQCTLQPLHARCNRRWRLLSALHMPLASVAGRSSSTSSSSRWWPSLTAAAPSTRCGPTPRPQCSRWSPNTRSKSTRSECDACPDSARRCGLLHTAPRGAGRHVPQEPATIETRSSGWWHDAVDQVVGRVGLPYRYCVGEKTQNSFGVCTKVCAAAIWNAACFLRIPPCDVAPLDR